jgi:Tfp pilus assembly protein FimV
MHTMTHPLRPDIFTRRPLHAILCATVLMLGQYSVQAQGREGSPASGPALSPAAMEALERLIGRSVAGGSPESRTRSPRNTVVVQRGETLDAIMRRTVKDLPFRDEALRKAFMSLNPEAFVQGSPHRLHAGASLRVPTLEDVLVSSNLIPVRSQAAPAAAPSPDEAHHTTSPGPYPRAMERRHWVRYP